MNPWSPAQQRFWAEASLRSNKKAYKRARPRADEPWRLSEDRRLLRLTENINDLPVRERGDAWQTLAVKFKRSPEALRTRACALRAGLRICRKRS